MDSAVKCLLVDDVDENLVALEGLLAKDGVEVHTASSGTQALELLLVHDFAVALVDVHMPGMDGFELAELMRGSERSKHVPIIFVTAELRENSRVFKGYESGAVDFLFKPVDPRVLCHKVDVFFQLYRQRMQLETYVAVLGHDLRDPLGAMTTGAYVLERLAKDKESAAIAARIMSSGMRMARMIDQLLDLSRARLAGGIPLVTLTCDLHTIAERVVAELRTSAPKRAVSLEVMGNCRGEWDEARIGQVLSNLLGNADRHGAAGGAIEVRIDARQQQIVTVTVANAGSIPPDVLPHIFDPFRSGRHGRTPSDGLGLGLYIVEQVVRAHRGSVRVESSAAQRTVFEVVLPRRPVFAAAENVPSERSPCF